MSPLAIKVPGTSIASSGEMTVRGYALGEELGRGAYACVYQAIQPGVGREVAVKVIKAEHANRPDFIRRFESEAQIISQLEHLHIVPLYDYWREPDGAYLVMRLMRGGTLKDALKKRGFGLEEVCKLIDQVASALATAHR